MNSLGECDTVQKSFQGGQRNKGEYRNRHESYEQTCAGARHTICVPTRAGPAANQTQAYKARQPLDHGK